MPGRRRCSPPAIQKGDCSYAAAAGVIKGVVSSVLIIAANKVAHLLGEAGVYQKA